jgi:plasmid rolling circle replication initiator protein Rep
MQKYNEKKLKNQVLAGFSSSYVSKRMQQHICICGHWLTFIADWEEAKLRLESANFCKWRFCPMCAWRKSRVDAQRISVLMSYIAAKHKRSFIMVTLTAPNVKRDKLSEEITKYNKAFKEFVRTKEIAGMNHGYLRKLEITYNEERDDYHPHFHVVFAVNSSYFSGGQYLKQAKWLDLWRDCMKDNSITQVDVRAVKRKTDPDTLAESFDVEEFAKYAAKDADYLKSKEVFDGFYQALKGRQQITYSGIFAVANKKYKADELADYIETDKTVYYWVIMYQWKGKEYKERKRRALDATDKIFLARRGIDTELTD